VGNITINECIVDLTQQIMWGILFMARMNTSPVTFHRKIEQYWTSTRSKKRGGGIGI
jgi:hypothetical protein